MCKVSISNQKGVNTRQWGEEGLFVGLDLGAFHAIRFAIAADKVPVAQLNITGAWILSVTGS